MATTAADILIDALSDWGVEVIFGMPGDGINGIMEALRTRQDTIRFIQVRHEEAAAFMACAYAKYTGRLGVCLATSGPGRRSPCRPGRPSSRNSYRARTCSRPLPWVPSTSMWHARSARPSRASSWPRPASPWCSRSTRSAT